MLRLAAVFALFFLSINLLQAQMWNGRDTLYGNEWIDYAKTYYRIPVAEDGMYRLSYETLQQSGLPLDNVSGAQFQLFHFGREVPLDVTTTGLLAPGDYLAFYGQKNRGELDRHLYKDPDAEMLNPRYSLFTDTSAYYLTWVDAGQPTLRYEPVAMDFSDLPAPETYFMDTAEVVFGEKHSKFYVRDDGFSIYPSNFTVVEGFGSGSSKDLYTVKKLPDLHRKEFELGLSGLADISGVPVVLRIRFGCGPDEHHQVLQVNGETYGEFRFIGFGVKDTIVTIPTENLRETLNISLEGRFAKTEGNTQRTWDGQTVAFAQVTYPRRFDAQNRSTFSFSLPASGFERYFEIERFQAGAGETVMLYDLTAGRRCEAAYENGRVRIQLPPISTAHRYYVVNSRQGLSTAVPWPIQFENYLERPGNYIILSHPALMDNVSGRNLVREYAAYRASAAGGGYDTVVVDIQQLYEQFSYGIRYSPLAVRNFAHHLMREWSDPRYFFIIGKGREFIDVRRPEEMAGNAGGTFFVPSFGYPASDNLLFSNNDSSVPVLPVGRIAATSPEGIRIYLDKVKALEANVNNPQTVEGRAWMKRVMHLGGGSGASERQLIKNNLAGLESIIERNVFGAEVFSYYKLSTDAIETSISDQIFRTINGGLSIITFFGHSSPGTFDFNIDNPDNYDNYGKYPLMLSLGCYSGNTFTPSRSIGERFTFYQDRGAIAFGASSGLGYVSSLYNFAREFYRYIGSTFYGRGIGDVLRAAIARYDTFGSISTKTLMQQFNLHGDPAIRLHPAPGPDYVVDARSVRFTPGLVTAQMDSFTLSFEVVNLGRYQPDSVSATIKQELPSGEQIELGEISFAAPPYAKTLSFTIPGRGPASVGRNIFLVTLDPENENEELPNPAAEMNNELMRSSGEAGIPLFIVDNTARPVHPVEFGIVNTLPLTLKASTTNAFASARTYIMELDTTALFNSPSKLRKEIEQGGGVISWQPEINLQPGEVYYWRVSPDSTVADLGYTWSNSSFTYLPESDDGWNQGDYWQWLEGDTSGLRGDERLRKLRFVKTFKGFRIKNKVYEESDPAEGYINNTRWSDFFRWERPQSINIAVFDTLGQIVWNPRPGAYGSLNRTARKEIAAFLFPVDTQEERLNIINFLEDTIPDHSYVFVYTAMRRPDLNLNVDEWARDSIDADGKNLFNVLEKQGALEVRSLEGYMRPYIFGFRKNKNDGVIVERAAFSLDETLNFETSIQGFLYEGELTTPPIGPASSWDRFEWQFTPSHEYDISRASIIGISPQGKETILQDSITVEQIDLSVFSAQTYPYLKLRLYAKDSLLLSPADLNFWRVLYEGLPDAALNTAFTDFVFHSDTLQQGDPLRLTLSIENVSDYPIDSLSIRYVVTNENNEEQFFSRGVPGIPAQSRALARFELDTREMLGLQNASISLNPARNPAERTYFNNQGNFSFTVQTDRRNPILDVTFDGQPILDGDIVSARPQIDIRLQDENQFLLLEDTSLFSVTLEDPDLIQTRISLGDNPQIQFYPAVSGQEKNQARIVYSPEFTRDGQYRLLINARDASGNAAGNLLYEKRFEVITRKAISNVVNYPNPFSTATRFVYTLTGDEPPAFFKIQIMTTSGRIVREITEAEIGPLRIGTHRTDYVWDGRDDYGDELANGVYLYRVVAKDTQGKDFEHHDNGLQSYFKNGIGKLVILK